jgi:hypothetical protein
MFHPHDAYGWVQRMAQAMPAQLLIDGRERPIAREGALLVLHHELRPMVSFGPEYQRDVADAAQRALVDFNRERGEASLSWLEQACETAARLRTAKIGPYDSNGSYVTATSWCVSTDTGTNIDGAVLNVHDVDPDRPTDRGGIVIHHPVHAGRQFTSRDEARAYALRMGLLKRPVPRAALA